MTMPPVVPALAPVPGSDLLDQLHDLLTTYVVLPTPEATDAVVLWIAATHALPAFQHAPRLAIGSPEKRCGKSRLLEIIAGTCHQPLKSMNATVAAIFRSIGGEHPPTLLIDEADAMFGTKVKAEQNEDLRALLNAGHARGQTTLRCVGPLQTPTEFPTFTMAAIAGIGNLPDTITDRAVNVTMCRRRGDEQVRAFRARRDGGRLEEFRDRLAAWAFDQLDQLADAEPAMPVEDRAADTWEPLVAVADSAGGSWPNRARTAALVLTGQADAEDIERSATTRLLADVRDVFTRSAVPFLPSAELLARLQEIEESPWSEWAMTTRKLALRLRQFGVRPGRDATGNARGYRLEDLADAFARYLPPLPPSESDRSVRKPSDLHERSDASSPSDASTRQTIATRQSETAGHPTVLTGLTGSDDPPEGVGPGPGHTQNGKPEVDAPTSFYNSRDTTETTPPTCSTCGTEVWPGGLCVVCESGGPEAAENTPVDGDENCPICGHAVLIHVGIKCGTCVGWAQTQLAAARAAAESDRDEEAPS